MCHPDIQYTIMDQTTRSLKENLKKAEGLSLKAYRDSLGFWTIGYGHLIHGEVGCEEREITLDEADAYLDADIKVALDQARGLPEFHSLNDVRRDAVVELVFNLGVDKWKKFVKTRAAIADERWQDASNNLKNSLWYTQVGHRRGDRIAKQLLKGTYEVSTGPEGVA